MMKYWISLFLLAGCSARMVAPQSQVLPAQTQPAATAGGTVLGKTIDLDVVIPFTLDPPDGFTLFMREGASGDRIWTWQGPLREDGTAPTLSVGISDPRAEGSEAFKVLQMADKMRLESDWVLNMTLSLHGSSPKFERTKTEHVQINGLPFARACFSSPYREGSDTLAHGVLYVAAQAERVIEIWAIEAEPHHETFLSLAELAIMTFKEKETR
jgi:hypothetical protein